MTASLSEMLAMQVKVLSPKLPKRQFLPVSGDGELITSLNFALTGDDTSTLHALICLMPTVTTLLPTKHIPLTTEVHLLVECNFAEPVFELTAQTLRNPSLISPRVARYCESGLNAILLTPKLCSVKTAKGASFEESGAVENINTRGLYPV